MPLWLVCPATVTWSTALRCRREGCVQRPGLSESGPEKQGCPAFPKGELRLLELV